MSEQIECGCVLGYDFGNFEHAVDHSNCRIAALETKLSEMALERDCLIAQRHMTIARLGGSVEGHPTCELDFLQRVDELRERETELSGIKKEFAEHRAQAAEYYASLQQVRNIYSACAFELSLERSKVSRAVERLRSIKAAVNSGSFFDADGTYADGVIEALQFVLGESSELMPWIKP